MRSRRLRQVFSVIGLAAMVQGLWGQDKSTYFTVMHPDQFSIDWTGFYDSIDRQTAQARKQLRVDLDISFGPHPKQALDLYLPKGSSLQDAPVFVFIHGGGFREGDRSHYGYVARPFAKHGIITAVVGYRLTPQGFHFPSQPQDIQAAIEWIYKNIRALGGDRDRIYVGGHSAGAILSSFVTVQDDWLKERGLPADLIKGCAPISGPYDLRIGGYDERPGESDAYANTNQKREQASPIININYTPPACVVAVGGVEEAYIETSRELVEKLKARGSKATLMILEGENHDDTAISLGKDGHRLFRAVLSMITSGG